MSRRGGTAKPDQPSETVRITFFVLCVSARLFVRPRLLSTLQQQEHSKSTTGKERPPSASVHRRRRARCSLPECHRGCRCCLANAFLSFFFFPVVSKLVHVSHGLSFPADSCIVALVAHCSGNSLGALSLSSSTVRHRARLGLQAVLLSSPESRSFGSSPGH